MAEWLTHVLFAYVLATLLSVRYTWITREYVTIAMIGAIVPDLNRMDLVVDDYVIEAVLGIPFSWGAFHTLGGSLVAVAVGALLVGPRYRIRVFALLVLGMASHHALDLLLINLTGYSYAVLWPLTWYAPPTPGIYSSSDRWPAVVAILVAAVVWRVDARRGG
jgi:membrane-bound metal-dependent hydrolase YbcI (DUF457 family)